MSEHVGPVDYLVVEFPGNRFNGEILPALTDLIARGMVRILDIAFIRKDGDGNVEMLELEELPGEELGAFAGIAPFLVDLVAEEDLIAAAAVLEPNSSALFVVWENTWAAPFAAAVRGSGGEVVASGRIPLAAVLEALEA